MSEDTKNDVTNAFMYELLKSIQGDLTDIKSGQLRHDKRFSALERQLNRIESRMTDFEGTLIDVRDELSGQKTRTKRIERRLELSEPPAEH